MSGMTTSDRFLRAGPLVLRWGLAAILLYNGWNQASPMFGAETGESFLADVQGVELSANWGSVLGIGQLAVGGLLFLGLFTRLVSLAVLGGVGYCVYTVLAAAPAESAAVATEPAVSLATQLFETSGASLLLLAAACASLLLTGAGCIGLDTRRARRAGRVDIKPD